MDGLAPFFPSKRIEYALPKLIHLGVPRSNGGAPSYSWDVVRPRTRGGIARGGRTGEKTKRAAPLEKISERRRKRRKKWRRSLFTSSSDRLEMTANLEEEEEEKE